MSGSNNKKLRIAHILSAPCAGGAEIFARDLMFHQQMEGCDVLPVFLNRAVDVGNCQVFERSYLCSLRSRNIAFEYLGVECRKNVILGMIKLRRILNRQLIDVCHSHLLYGVLFSAMAGRPVVYTHHTSIPQASWLMYRIFNRIVRKYVGISEICSDVLSRFTGKDVTTIFNGVDGHKLCSPSVRLVGDEMPVRFISVGRILAPKNYPFLIEAIASLPDRLSNRFSLDIVGDGTPEALEGLSRIISRHGLSERIRLLGSRTDVPDLLAKADVFLMSSAWEGLPIALLEASMSGLPCVVTDVGGCREVVEKCRNGLVVSSNDLNGFADAVSKFILFPEIVEKFSRNAIERSGFFSIQKSVREYIDVYRALI